MLLLLILNSAAKVRKSLDITKHFLDFNTNLTLVGQNMAKQEGECSRIPLTLILTYNLKTTKPKTYEKTIVLFKRKRIILPLLTSVLTSR